MPNNVETQHNHMCICNAVYFMVSCDFIAACSYTNESQIYILFLKRGYYSNTERNKQ